jgi:uncharacterized damage-inducible protein DinB
MTTHTERIAHTRQAFREAHARFVKRLTEAPAADLERAPEGGGWSAAQIGWHVAAVNTAFAGLISGEVPGAKELPEGATAKPWSQIAGEIPEKLEAGKRVQPPPAVARAEVLQALSTAEAKMDAALASLQEHRGARYAITHPVFGTVAIGDIGDWAVAHTIRHNAQAKRVLGG